MSDFGNFASGLLGGFAQARGRKKAKEEEAKEKKFRLKLIEIQMDREKRAQAEADKKGELRQSFFDDANDRFAGTKSYRLPGTGVRLGDVDATLADQRPPAKNLLQLLTEGNMGLRALEAGIVGPEALMPKEPEVPNEIRELEFLQKRPDLLEIDTKRRQASAARTDLTVDSRQENAEAAAVGKGFAEQYMAIQKSGLDAQSKLTRLDRMSHLMDGVATGRIQPSVTQIAAFADSFGIKIDPKLGEKQAITQLTNEMALQLRNPSGGAGMPGSMSDADREFLMKMPPGLAQSPEGNKLIIETAKKLAERDRDVARLAREYRQKNGQLDEGFFDYLAAFSAANPLFTAETSGADLNELSDEDILKALRLKP